MAFFLLAVVTLIAGTTTCYIRIPYLYMHQDNDITPSTTAISPDFIHSLVTNLRIGFATDALLSATFFAVKFSFLFFFRGLLRRVRGLMTWWSCILGSMVPISIYFISAPFIVCPYFNTEVLAKCSTPAAATKSNNIQRTSAFLDIFTDVLLISIPVALLWRVRISLRRKLVLGGVLCLSIFTMIVQVICIAGSDLPDGTVDAAWVNFWLQVEAAVAVMIVSLTSYRSLFVKDQSLNRQSPPERTRTRFSKERLWNRSAKGEDLEHQVGLPSVPNPVLTGVRTFIESAPYDGNSTRSDDCFLPLQGRNILVTHDQDIVSGSSSQE